MVLVILNHLFGWPSGGFVGVDVFYVLSGYLITGLLLREYNHTGWISFRSFYARRIRRIMPVALLVLVVTVLTSYVLWYAPRADQTLLDAIAALFFVENWHLIRIRTDYLQAGGAISPVQHYWSLSVEEQFYVVWPWFILLGLTLAFRKRPLETSVRFMFIAISVVITASFAWCVVTSRLYSRQGYFDTVSRVWELAAGALLAVVVTRLTRIGPRTGGVMTWAGLALLIGATLLITPELAFPGPWAALPVFATVIIVIGGSGGYQNAVLSHRGASYIGDISYSLYLWHFPVIILTSTIVERSLASIAFMITLMIALSALSYRFVEDPIRRSSWLRSWNRPVERRRPEIVGAAAVAVVMIGCLGVQMVGPARLTNAVTLRGDAETRFTAPRDWSDQTVLSAKIVEAAHATDWPAVLTPPLKTLSTADGAAAMDSDTGCRNPLDDAGPLHYCNRPGSGPTAKTALVIGDSVALSWIPSVEAARPHWRVLGLGFANCPAVPVRVDDSGDACAQAQDQMLAFALEVNPEMIITSSNQGTLANLASKATGAAAQQEWAQATTRFIKIHSASDVYVMSNPPPWDDSSTCLTRFAVPQDCNSTIDEQYEMKARAEVIATARGGTFVDTRDWFCTRDNVCPGVIDGVVLRADRSHLTNMAAQSYGSRLEPILGRS